MQALLVGRPRALKIKQTVEKVQAIAEMVLQINDTQNLISAAIEEQTSVTNEIAVNVTSVSDQGRDVSTSLAIISNNIVASSSQAIKLDSATVDLKKLASHLADTSKNA